jgi:hypothetical protein
MRRLPARRRIQIRLPCVKVKMCRILTVSIAALLFLPQVSARRSSSDRARAWLRQAADALGGEAKLRALKAVEIDGLSVWQQREQSERPEGPWVETFNDFTDIRNLKADEIMRTTRVRGYSTPDWVDGPDWFPAATTLYVSGVGLRRAADRVQPAGTAWDVGEMPLELGPERAVVTALDEPSNREEADVMFHSHAHHVVSFAHRGAHVRLLLNPPTMMPAAVEITRARPYETFWAPWGDVTNRVTFGQWTLEPEGVRFPRLWEYSTGDQVDGTVTITRVRLNPAFLDADFAVSDDVRQQFLLNRRRVMDVPLGRADRPAIELAPGVVKIPANFDILEVKQDDGVVIVEGPLTSSYSEKVIDDARRRFDGAAVKAVITTSDSWPHIGGVREYVARGVPIYALDLNVPILNRLFAARYETFPDALAKAPKAARFKTVSKKTVVGSGANRIELYPLRTVTGERQMMAYFPAHRLLYTSDLFSLRANGDVFLPQQALEAVDAVTREHLEVDRAFGMHYDVVPWSTILTSARPPAPRVQPRSLRR